MALPFNFSFVWNKQLAGSGHPGAGGELISALSSLDEAGIKAVITLTEDPLELPVLREFGFAYLHLPVGDFTAPTQEQIDQAVQFIDRELGQNHGALIHCRAGIGRTGTMLACYLVSKGLDPAAAIDQVRESRPGSCEVYAQEYAVHQYARRLRLQDDMETTEGG
ncbi:dual specificity protein phosphatase family protein [bacterium]|nr:dual specificity protein phosphatase family protein [bacterium]